jgi:serine/threonine protein kinase
MSSLIATGSFGEVFSHNDYVVKKVQITSEEEDDQIVYSTIREVAFLRKIEHPNIIKMIDVSIQKDKNNQPECHIILEHGGISLSKWMRETRNRFPLIVYIAYQILEALAFLEKQNITHCDLKPSNILIDKNNHVRLIDFGGVSFKSAPDSISLCSTRGYQAPEQCKFHLINNKKVKNDIFQVGSFNDIFSFGLTMFTLLFAEHPPDEIHFSNNTVDILKNYKKSLSDICDIEDMNIIKLFLSCLEFDYTNRPRASQLLKNPLFKKYKQQSPYQRHRIYYDLSFLNTPHNSCANELINQTNRTFKSLFHLKRWKYRDEQFFRLYAHVMMNKLLSKYDVLNLLLFNDDYKFFFPHFCVDLAIILFDDKVNSHLIDFDEVDCYFEIRQEMHLKILPMISFDIFINL